MYLIHKFFNHLQLSKRLHAGISIIHKNKAQVDDLPKKIIKGTLRSHFSYRNIPKRGNNKKILQELYAP